MLRGVIRSGRDAGNAPARAGRSGNANVSAGRSPHALLVHARSTANSATTQLIPETISQPVGDCLFRARTGVVHSEHPPYAGGMAAAEHVRVLLLGTDHLDIWDGEHGPPDILSAQKQTEAAEVIERLKPFAPTKVALEMLASSQPKLERRYAKYLEGSGGDDRNEIVQLGFRLARETQATVHAVDADWTLAHGPVEEFFAEHPDERFTDDLSPELQAAVMDTWRASLELPLPEYLRYLNDPPVAQLNDREYLDRWLPVGAGHTWAGVDLVASWYRRNLRILANLQQASEPGDRIVLLIGSGHAPSLQHFLEVSGRFEYVSPLDFL